MTSKIVRTVDLADHTGSGPKFPRTTELPKG